MCGMDVITQIRLVWLGGLGALYRVALGTVWLLGEWQHRREQRRSRLLERVRWQFPVELRDQIALQVRGMMLGRRAGIIADMGHHAPAAWWSIVAGLSRNLLPDVRRLVFHTDARPCPVTLAITPGRRRVSRPAASPRPPNGHQGRGHRVHVPPAPLAAVHAGGSERGPLSETIDIPSAFTGHLTGW
jgi:hypothetical protein